MECHVLIHQEGLSTLTKWTLDLNPAMGDMCLLQSLTTLVLDEHLRKHCNVKQAFGLNWTVIHGQTVARSTAITTVRIH